MINHIQHKYSEQMSQQSEVVHVGSLRFLVRVVNIIGNEVIICDGIIMILFCGFVVPDKPTTVVLRHSHVNTILLQ